MKFDPDNSKEDLAKLGILFPKAQPSKSNSPFNKVSVGMLIPLLVGALALAFAIYSIKNGNNTPQPTPSKNFPTKGNQFRESIINWLQIGSVLLALLFNSMSSRKKESISRTLDKSSLAPFGEKVENLYPNAKFDLALHESNLMDGIRSSRGRLTKGLLGLFLLFCFVILPVTSGVARGNTWAVVGIILALVLTYFGFRSEVKKDRLKHSVLKDLYGSRYTELIASLPGDRIPDRES